MYLWGARNQTRRGAGPKAASYMGEVRDLVSSITGIPFWSWACVAGAPLGTLMMSARVDSMEQFMAATMAVTGNADYAALTKSGADLFDGPTETVMGQVVGMAGEMGSEPSPLIVVTTATAAPGRQGDAMAWGVDMLDYMAELTGTSGFFTMAAVGSISDVSWIQSHDDSASIDRTMGTLMTDEGYRQRMGAAGGLFVAGSGNRIVMAKMP
ncbi:MAG: hypothetical protein OES24_22935 [Acidimicrobiia bacterium]|nr:hypothetical protein [Acidimicrobiia bacterium]